jgi:branched-chain amino acid transport system permease protein
MIALAARKALIATALVAGPLALVAFVGDQLLEPADQRVVLSFFITLVLALAIQVFAGPTGILSFGHVAFVGVGAYVGAMLAISPAVKETIAPDLPGFIVNAQLGIAVILPIAFAAGAVVSGVIGIVFARMEETAMAMATVSLLLIFGVLFDAADGITGGAQGVYAIPETTTMVIALVAALAMIFFAQLFTRSAAGIQLRASRSAPLAARALGVRLVKLRWVAWTLSGGLAALGGALWAGHAIAFSPGEFDFDLTFSLLAALVLGGVGSVAGTVLGAAALTVVFEVFRRIESDLDISGLTQIAVALLILFVLYWRPSGLLGYRDLPEALRRPDRTST